MKHVSALFLLAVCTACSRPPVLTGNQHNVTASLDDSIWFGTAQPVKIVEEEGQACRGKRFMLVVRTDIPYKGGPPPKQPIKITGCLDNDCWMMQALNFENIPFKKGKYNLRRLANCGTLTGYHYWQTYPGNGTFRAYTFKANSSNWVRIRRIDKTAKLIEGEFASTLSDTTRQIKRFRNGAFRVKYQE